MRRICVFCGSNAGASPVYADVARALAHELARRGMGLVYGGGRVGLMGVVADAALAAGVEVIGVIPQSLVALEVGHRGLRDLRVVRSMHERKALMAELSDGFVALPGGYGTLDEFCEVLTWAQLGLHRKPCAALNVNRYFDPLLALLDHAVAERFLSRAHRQFILVGAEPAPLMDAMLAYRPIDTAKWLAEEDV